MQLHNIDERWLRKSIELENTFESFFGKESNAVSFIDLYTKIKNSDFYESRWDDIGSKIESLYSETGIHGKLHIIKVVLFTWYIAIELNCSKQELGEAILAAIYHDAGRADDSEDLEHGKTGSLIYKKECIDYMEYDNDVISYAIEAHSCPDEMMPLILNKYQIDNKEHAIKIAKILKDADALDRYRINIRALDASFLRFKCSVNMRKAAFVLCHYCLEQYLLDNKPEYLYHLTFSNGYKSLKPSINWDMYGEHNGNWVFATQHINKALLYFLHGQKMFLYSFEYRDKTFAIVPSKEPVNEILKNQTLYLYQIHADSFKPVISNEGRFDGEWISDRGYADLDKCKYENVTWNDIYKNGVRVLYPVKEEDYEVIRKMIIAIPRNQQKLMLLDFLLKGSYIHEYKGE